MKDEFPELEQRVSSIETSLSEIQKDLEKIKQRNQTVALNKAWETSKTRIITIIVLTYILMSLFMSVLGNNQPFLNSLIPTIGYVLSTLSIPIIKNIWKSNK